MAPNPLPAGRCGDIRVELVDDHGYRRTTLSNGAAIDTRKFKFAISDPSHITVQNDASVAGRVCADTGPTASTITVTVTLPDGLRGTLQIVLVPKGQVGQRAVAYRPQAPLRLPTSPEYAPGFVVAGATARANGVSSGVATSAASSGGGAAVAAGVAGAAGAAGSAATGAAGTVGTVGTVGTAGAAGAAGVAGAAGTAGAAGVAGAAGAAGVAGAAEGAGAAGAAGAGGAAGAASGSTLPGTNGATPMPSASATPVVTKSLPAPSGASSADPKTSPSLRRGTSAKVSTGTLSLLGARHVPAPATITTGMLSLLGARHVPPPATITTATLSLTGINSPAAAPVNSPVGATPKPMTSQKPHSP